MVQIGQGTYSSVYKARDLENNKLVALKKVRFANMDPESVRFMAREIIILRRLDHPNIMKLEGLITSRVSGSLYLVFEYMEHDLAGLAATPGVKFTEAQVRSFSLLVLAVETKVALIVMRSLDEIIIFIMKRTKEVKFEMDLLQSLANSLLRLQPFQV